MESVLGMKLSTYGFKNLERTYSVIQFEDHEIGAVVDTLKNTDIGKLKSVLSKAIGKELRELCIAVGKLLYEEQVLETVYVRIHTVDNDELVLEIYRESGTAISNMPVPEAHKKIIDLLKEIYPSLKIPRTKIIGF